MNCITRLWPSKPGCARVWAVTVETPRYRLGSTGKGKSCTSRPNTTKQIQPFLGYFEVQSRTDVRTEALGMVGAAAVRPGVPVRLIVPHLHLQFGEQLKCVGESAPLGNWYSNAAPFLSWTEGHTWIHHSLLPPGTHKFKLVIVRDGGSMYWEEGQDRSFEVPEGVDGALEVSCEFGDTSKTFTQVIDAAVLEERAGEFDSDVEEDLEAAASGNTVDSPSESPSKDQMIDEASQIQDETAAMSSGGGAVEPEESIFADEVVVPEDGSSHADEPSSLPPPQPVTTNGNGSNFKTYGGAKAAVIDNDSVLVTFSDSDDDEDLASLAERILSRRKPESG